MPLVSDFLISQPHCELISKGKKSLVISWIKIIILFYQLDISFPQWIFEIMSISLSCCEDFFFFYSGPWTTSPRIRKGKLSQVAIKGQLSRKHYAGRSTFIVESDEPRHQLCHLLRWDVGWFTSPPRIREVNPSAGVNALSNGRHSIPALMRCSQPCEESATATTTPVVHTEKWRLEDSLNFTGSKTFRSLHSQPPKRSGLTFLRFQGISWKCLGRPYPSSTWMS